MTVPAGPKTPTPGLPGPTSPASTKLFCRARVSPPCPDEAVSKLGYCSKHTRSVADFLVDRCREPSCPYVAIDSDSHCWGHRYASRKYKRGLPLDIVWHEGMTIRDVDQAREHQIRTTRYTCGQCTFATERFRAVDDEPKHAHLCRECARLLDPTFLHDHYVDLGAP